MNGRISRSTIAIALGIALTVGACEEDNGETVTASGTIDATAITVSSQHPGRVSEVYVEEGDRVEPGAKLVQLDTSLVDAQIAEAEAAVEAAEAQRDDVTAEPRPPELRMARAKVDAAAARWEGARRAWANSQRLADSPQLMAEELLDASAQVSRADVQQSFAQEALGVARERRDRAEGDQEVAVADARVDAAEAQLEQAESALEGAQLAYRDLVALRDDPQEAEAAVDRAQAAYRQARAGLAAAQANLELLEAGPTDEEVEAAEAVVRQATAALEALQEQRDELTLEAPAAGSVSGLAVSAGELVSPGVSLMKITNSDVVELVVYVSEENIGDVSVGDTVEAVADAFPDDEFEGEITFIADEAEFTPRNVQTEEQRVNLVFAVTIVIENDDGDLRPGMPAEATIELD